MKMIRILSLGVCGLIASATATAATDATYKGVKYSTQGDIVVGEWTCQFDKAKAYAEANDLPLIVFWGNRDCQHCQATETAMSGTTFTEWQAERGLVMCFNVKNVTDSASATKAYNFTCEGGTSYPYLGVYWKGHALSGLSKVKEKQCYSMPDKSASQVIAKIEALLKDYVYNTGSSFAVTESAYNRYEAEASTKSITVELVRRVIAASSDETLRVLGPTGATLDSYTVTWPANITNRSVDVAIPAGALKKNGDQLTLTIDGKTEAGKVTHITYVDAPASPENPLWDTDRSDGETPLGFGEWTFDLAAATNLARKTGGSTLVMVAGSQWCPNCYRFEKNFLELTNELGEVRFEKWARENKIALAVVDVPALSGGKIDKATLLSREVFKGPDYKDDNATYDTSAQVDRSGLGYLSRKGVAEETAKARLDAGIALAGTYTSEGGFLRPEDTEDKSCNGYRPRVPCFCLLRADGTCAARMTRFTFPNTPKVADRVWFDNYLKRFDEMLKLAADEHEVENDSAGAGSAALTANGGVAQSTLCAADLRDTYRLDGFNGNGIQKVVVSSASGNLNPNAQVTVSYWRVIDGVATAVTGAEASGKLSSGVSKELSTTEVGDYYVQIKARNVGPETLDAEFNPTNATPDNFTTYSVKAEIIAYTPGEKQAEGVAGLDGTATVVLTQGASYRFDGIDAAACGTVLEATDEAPHKYFRALAGGEQALAVTGGAGTKFYFQLWKPGTVGFVETEDTVTESVNDEDNDWLEIAVSRTGGSSGAVTVPVTLDAATDLYNLDYDEAQGKIVRSDPRFEFANTNLVWADGDSATKYVLVKILDDSDQPRYDGDGQVVLKLGEPVGPAADVGKGEDTFTLYVTEDERADPGRAMFTHAEPYYAKAKTVYARAGEGAYLFATRFDGSDGLFGVEVKSSVSGVGFETENERDLSEVESGKTAKTILWWSNRESGEKYLKVTNVPAGKTAKITLAAYTSGSISSKVVSSSNSVSVVSVANDAPYFGSESVDAKVYRYVAVSNVYNIYSTQGGKLTFTKLSGSLPTGLKVGYDPVSGGMFVAGVPTAAGSKSYEAVYQVTEQRYVALGSTKTTKVPGLTIRLAYATVDPAVSGGGEAGDEPLNDFFATSRTYSDIAVIEGDDEVLAGTLTLTIPRTGKASAKYLSALGSLAFSAKSFGGILPEETKDVNGVTWPAGTVLLTLGCTSKAYAAATLAIWARPDGFIRVDLSGMSGKLSATAEAPKWSKQDSASAYQGQYTVALLLDEVTTNGIYGLAPKGSAYLTLKMTSSSQWNAGKMTWAGALANGTAVSGSAVLTEEQLSGGKIAYLPVVKQSKTDFFSAYLRIQPEAKAKAESSEDEECYRTIDTPTVTLNDEQVKVRPYWSHTENSKYVPEALYVLRYKLYGGIYDLTHGLNCCCEKFVGTTNLTLRVDMPVDSEYYGTLGPVTGPTITVSQKTIVVSKASANPQNLKLSLNSSGVVTGSFNLPYNDAAGKEKTLKASYKGVVLIGWSSACGCGSINLPFVNGAWTFTDRVGYETTSGKTTVTKYISVKRGDVIETNVP